MLHFETLVLAIFYQFEIIIFFLNYGYFDISIAFNNVYPKVIHLITSNTISRRG